MLLQCQSISKSFSGEQVLSDCSFHIEANEKAAIVGINGAGKSTLLKIIVGELAADSGTVTLAKDASVGYLSQRQSVSGDNTIFQELLSVKAYLLDMEKKMRLLEARMKDADDRELPALMDEYAGLHTRFEHENGYAVKSEVTGVLKGLGFLESEFGKKIETLSGGQKTRIALGKLLLEKPDLILLDEPTNHLDMDSVAWLETYLKGYPKAVVIVAHDRYFLDRTVNKVIELSQTKAAVFSGNYSEYAHKKEALRLSRMRAYLNQQQEIRRQEEVIAKLRSFNREKSIRRAESREKMLDKLEILEKPTEANDSMNFTLDPRVLSGSDVLTVEGLSKAFPPLTLFIDVSFEIKRGEHVAVIGSNGTGKTTLLKIINGLVKPDSGRSVLGSRVEIGYYDQEQQVLNDSHTLFEEISDAYPDLSNTQIRNTLAAFLFTGDDVFKRIGDLSGGEKGRVSLAKLMLSSANFLILDEPTNHLDITSKEILEQAVNQYTGTVLYVSHDRYFINRTAQRILDLTGQSLVSYPGNYDYYLEKREEVPGPAAPGRPEDVVAKLSALEEASARTSWISQKEEQARARKRENELKRTEDSIHELEMRSKDIDDEMADPSVATDAARLQELHREKESLLKALDDLYEKWEELAQ